MADTIVIQAEARDRAGKGAAREARRAGKIPGVIYGDGKPPVLISIDRHSMRRLLLDPHLQTHLLDVMVAGEKHHVLTRDVQLDPISDQAVHLDFMRVSERSRVTLMVPVEFVNQALSPGLKIGGVLNVVRHEVELVCRADSIPDYLTADLSGLEIGDSIRIRAIELPEGARPSVTDRDFVICTIAAPSAVRAEAQEAAAAAAAQAAPEPEA